MQPIHVEYSFNRHSAVCISDALPSLIQAWNTMKKTIALTHPKIKTARLVESIKHDIKKYLGRERRKTLPAGTDYWTFDCKFGASQDAAVVVFTSEINTKIDEVVEQELTEFYVEILVRAAAHKPKTDTAEESNDSGE
jgi:hypothetical protein